ncbi:MAG: site-2 protease family protein [Holophagales bacterium]|jgi:regulator of sigma E protease|nr:site-2 protease family protein [Holophagales bacterium]
MTAKHQLNKGARGVPAPHLALSVCTAACVSLFALAIPGSGILGPIVMLAGLIIVHELGHFLAAMYMGMPVEKFNIGFGPGVTLFKWREADVRLSILPLGGYVKLAGFNPEEPGAEDPYGFLKQPARRRILFYSGGIIANVIACAVLLYAVNVGSDRYSVRSVNVQVQEGSAAQAGGLVTGDELIRIGDLTLPGSDWNTQVVPYIRERPEQPLEVQIKRDGELKDMTLTPRLQGGIGFLGISATQVMNEKPDRPLVFMDFLYAVPKAIKETFTLGALVVQGFWKLISFQSSIKDIGGPIAIVKLGSEAAKAGWEVYCFMTAFISMNLAVLNALPIPFLDGGHICILLFEKLRRKDITIETKEKILAIGFYLMAAVMMLVVILDLMRLKS